MNSDCNRHFSQATTFVELLQARASHDPEAVAYRFLGDGEAESARITYGEQDQLARAIAAILEEKRAFGERALLLYPPTLEFINAFLGCLYAGVIAVPAYPPRSSRSLPRLLAIASDAKPRLILTTSATTHLIEPWVKQAFGDSGIEVIATDKITRDTADRWQGRRIYSDGTAFLQYTSGSTSSPKGVIVSHANLMHNEEMIRRAFRQSESSVIVSWLPLYHDMGLIGGVLQPLYAGAQCILMSPLAFVQKPWRWLNAVSTYRATTSGGPNFAYDLCARKISEEQRAELDLSSWKVAFNGAEPVRAETLQKFADIFAPCGFKKQSFFPCYGLAEATLFVSGGQVEQEPVICSIQTSELQRGRAAEAEGEGQELVGCGKPWMGQQVLIMNPETQKECAPGEVGEIWVSGPSVACGYWNKVEETARVFQARPAESGESTLRTGDLGFFRDGELFVTGRLKDLIIVRGRNFYPQDIEHIVENSHTALRAGCGAAFSIEAEGEEQVIVVQEVEARAELSGLEKALEEIRSAVAQEFELSLHDLVLIKQGTISKTSSGKIQRHKCREKYLNNELEVLARSSLNKSTDASAYIANEQLSREKLIQLGAAERRKALQQELIALLCQLLRISHENIPPERPLAALGLDSMEAIHLKHALEERLNVSVSLAFLLETATVEQLTAVALEQLEQEAVSRTGILPDAEEAQVFPLSYGQRGMWFAQQVAPESSAYNISVAVRASGPLDVEALQCALNQLMARHTALRTSFHQGQGGEPVQQVSSAAEVKLEVQNASDLPEESLARELNRRAGERFDLEKAPLMRAVVFRRSQHEQVLLLAMHHLAGDFWSFTLAFEELIRLYFQEIAAVPAQLPALSLRYSDYVRHQQQQLAGNDGEKLWSYWREALRLPLPTLDLHTDQPRPALQTYNGGSYATVIDREMCSALQQLSKHSGATLYTTLLATFQALLRRYTGQEDVLVGSPVTGRNNPQFANLVGFFTNLLMLRNQCREDISFRQYLSEVRSTVLGALDHQDYPFALLVERLQPARDLSRPPLCQAMFILQKPQRPELKALSALALGDDRTALSFGPLTLRGMDLPEKQTAFDLTLLMTETDSGLLASLQFNADLFQHETAVRMLNHFRTMLSGIIANPENRVRLLPLLTEAEQEELRSWNATEVNHSGIRFIHRVFEVQAERTPDAIAIEDATRRFSYKELNERANQLAHYLRKLGIGPEATAGICLGRTTDIAVALLGVLKAGGAYLPIDPALPEARIQYMLEDSGTNSVIGNGSLRSHFSQYSGRFVAIDGEWAEISRESSSPPHPVGTPENLAYVMYTSGSTGRPKGVQVTHASVVNFLCSMAATPGIRAADVLVSVTTLSFDIFGLELYLPLSVGARVVLASREVAMDGPALLQLLRNSGATVMQATPATWQLLLTTGKREIPPLRALCGGDVLSTEVVKELLSSGCEVWNLYGPTETTIWSSVHHASSAEEPSSWTLIGRAIANTQLYIMDPDLQPLPAGVPGELIIGGDGMARGYWNRAELTAERFIPDPLAHTPGMRMYRTGDLACRRADGRIEFLGRLDNQVKIRGFRIELQEIETALAAHPAVQQAVVAARTDKNNSKYLAAYVVPQQGTGLTSSSLRQFLLQRLPEIFVPSHFMTLDALPLTPNGKVDRKALPDPEFRSSTPEYVAPASELERAIAGIWKQVLNTQKISRTDNFFDLGGHSLLLAQVHRRLLDRGHKVSMLDLFKSPTIASLAEYLGSGSKQSKAVLAGIQAADARKKSQESLKSRDIAIIGMAGRFPKADGIEAFWKNIAAGEECISFFSDEELKKWGIAPAAIAQPERVKAGGVLENEDLFDASFFGFNPREAELMDPQHRVFLECAWNAFENAGYSPDEYEGRTGVYAGAGLNTYLFETVPALGESSAQRYQAFIGNDKDFLATRVSYKLNLKGPAVTLQTACSTSLVAVHLACQALLTGECDMALAGGVSIRIPQREGYIYEKGGILSPDGHCRAFDKNAEGTVFGSGTGIVVLKRLEAALEDNDTIYAVIKGSAINNDGSNKIGYTAPSVEGQAEVIAEALNIAGVEPETIGYIEAHGTGTSLGDPIEIAALSEAFQAKTSNKNFCAIGSVKTNVGHLDTAAGIAGLIKTVCAMRAGSLPPSINFTEASPAIDFANSPFYVNSQLQEWPRSHVPRRAGISSFGIGGTNAHVVIEEAPARTTNTSLRSWRLLLLSAKSDAALNAQTRNLQDEINKNPEVSIADLAYTLQVGRTAFAHRRAVLCSNNEEAANALERLHPEQVFTEIAADEKPQIVFLFPGQGSQYVNMGRELYEIEPVFRREIDFCADILKARFDLDLLQLLFPPPGEEERAAGQLKQTAITQPALFVVEYALARLWMNWGITPQAMMGHSIGEYVAACLAGTFTVEDALSLVALRGKLMQALPAGAMLGVRLPESETRALLSPELSIAALNSPNACVVSGTIEAIERLEKQLETKSIPCSRLHTSHAFHSAMMEPVLQEFTSAVGQVQLRKPHLPYISNLTGTWITASQATNPEYWAQHLRHAVRFADGLKELFAEPNSVFLEVGPGRTLSTLALQQNSRAACFSSLPHAGEQRPELRTILQALGRMWLKGVEVNWRAFHACERRNRIPLPGYPFERKRYWIKAEGRGGKKRGRELDEWFYVPVWRQATIPPGSERRIEGPVLVFEDESGFSERLSNRLRAQGLAVSTVKASTNFTADETGTYGLRAENKEQYHALAEQLRKAGALPRTVVYAWGITAGQQQFSFDPQNQEAWQEVRAKNFDAIVFLVQALEKAAGGMQADLIILSNNMQKVSGESVLQPEKALLLGPTRVIPQEYPAITTRSIDLVLPEFDGASEDLIDDVLFEMTHAHEKEVAYRRGERWVRDYFTLASCREEEPMLRLRERGVYLITGGLGGLGITFAETLAKECQAKLVLIGRSNLPSKAAWAEWLNAHGQDDATSKTIRKLQAIEELGGEVLVMAADVADRAAMLRAIHAAQEQFGGLNGVIHAAGVAGGGIIQLKEQEAADRVLRPKVLGTAVLNSILDRQKLDFFLLCSSITSITGGFGQSDYCGANAFCDAFAQASFRHRGCYIAAVNWDRWNEVGMAIKALPSASPVGIPELLSINEASVTANSAAHPLLGTLVSESNDRIVYRAEFSPERQWVLSEHQIAGHSMVPGTTYLEMVCAAFAQHSQQHPPVIQNVIFLQPLAVRDGEARTVFTVLEKKGNGYSFRVVSQPSSAQESEQWQEHAHGEIGSGENDQKQVRLDVSHVLQGMKKAGGQTISASNGNGNGIAAAHEKFIVTGPRWDVLKEVYLGERQAVGILELGQEFADDVKIYAIHPALLDVATGFVHFLTQGDFLPLTYQRIICFAPLPAKAVTYLRMHMDPGKSQDVLTSDISILDEAGVEAVRIENFSMKRVSKESLERLEAAGKNSAPKISIEQHFQRQLTPGLSTSDGARVFTKVLAHGRSPQIVVSTRDLHEVLHDAATMDSKKLLDELRESASQVPTHARPQLANEFSAPTDEIEQRIAAVWQRVLGVERVGIYDNFFELGGTSLNGIQVAAELKKELNVELPTVTIFEAPTVSALAKYLKPDAGQQQFQQVQGRAERKKQALEITQRQRMRAGAGRER